MTHRPYNFRQVALYCALRGIPIPEHYFNTKEQTMTTITGIPDGWKPVAFRKAEPTEYFIDSSGSVCMDMFKQSLAKWVIVERILELKDGKYYKQRNGEVVGPLYGYLTIGNGRRFASGPANKYTWSSDGICDYGSDYTLVQEVDPPKPKYRPYTKDEFANRANGWYTHKHNNGAYRAIAYGPHGVVFCIDLKNICYTYHDLLEYFICRDGSVAGILIS